PTLCCVYVTASTYRSPTHFLLHLYHSSLFTLFFFTHTAPTEIYTLSLHDALPISPRTAASTTCTSRTSATCGACSWTPSRVSWRDRKSTRLNSSHVSISYAVFCLKKKKKKNHENSIHKYKIDYVIHIDR